MSKTLIVHFTPRDGSYTKQMVDYFRDEINDKTDITEIDLVADQPSLLPVSDEGQIFKQVQEADHIVLGYPIWNFDAPAAIKAWIDQLVIPGQAFKKDEAGHHGLLTGKKVLIINAAGGNTSLNSNDFSTPMLKAVFGYVGIDDFQCVMASGFLNPTLIPEDLVSKAETELKELATSWYN